MNLSVNRDPSHSSKCSGPSSHFPRAIALTSQTFEGVKFRNPPWNDCGVWDLGCPLEVFMNYALGGIIQRAMECDPGQSLRIRLALLGDVRRSLVFFSVEIFANTGRLPRNCSLRFIKFCWLYSKTQRKDIFMLSLNCVSFLLAFWFCRDRPVPICYDQNS